MFSYYQRGLKSTTATDIITVDELVKIIRDDTSKERIKHLHNLAYKSDEYISLKERLPVLTPHGVLNGSRNAADVMKLSGYLYFDIDAEDIVSSVAGMKELIIQNYKEYISLIGLSVGGRGLFFYVRVEGLNKSNFTEVYCYFRDSVFRDLPTDKGAGGISRAQILPYDPDLYYNREACSSFPEHINQDPKTGELEHKYKRERCYDATIRFLPIREVMEKLTLQTQVDLGDEKFLIDPVEYYSVFIPRDIPDGTKHRRYRAITQIVMHLNPDVELITVQSLIYYINDNIISRGMTVREMLNTVANAYNKVRSTGEIHVQGRIKKVHTRKGYGYLARKINGLVRKLQSVAKIEKAKEDLQEAKKKVTKTMVARASGLCWKTVSNYWELSAADVFEEIEALK